MPRQSLRARSTRSKAISIIADRSEAILQMNGPLKRKFVTLERSVSDLRAENLRYYYRIGQICEEIRQKPDMYSGKDGTSAIKLIERALSTQARTLRKAAAFAREFTQRQLDQLIGMVNTETNFQLHWGHVSFLLTLPTHEKRQQFAAEAVEKMLDPPALHDLIKKRTKRSAGHGRKHEMPKTVAAQIRQILTFCRQWVAKNDEVWNGDEESVYGNIMNMPPEEMEPDMVEQLEEIKTLMTSISESAEANVAKTARAKEYIDQKIKRRQADEEAAATVGRQSRSIDLKETAVGRSRRRPATANA